MNRRRHMDIRIHFHVWKGKELLKMKAASAVSSALKD